MTELRNIREWTGILDTVKLFRLSKERMKYTKICVHYIKEWLSVTHILLPNISLHFQLQAIIILANISSSKLQ